MYSSFVHLDVESIDANAQVILIFDIFFTSVELFTFIDIFSARLAPEIKLEMFKLGSGTLLLLETFAGLCQPNNNNNTHFMLNGAIKRTVNCLFLAWRTRGILDGSKSGG